MKNWFSLFSRISLLILSAAFILVSCDQGIFNFNDETGNVSISFTADSVTDTLDKVVFALSNDSTDAYLEESCDISESSSVQSADSYFSRIDAGSWKLLTKVYDSTGDVIASDERYFDLTLGETVIIAIEYYSGGGIDSSFEESSVSEESMVSLDSMHTLIIAQHYGVSTVDTAELNTVNIAYGSGFETYLSGIRVDYPDNGFFMVDSGWSRDVGSLEVDLQSDMLSVTRMGTGSRGTHSMTLTDTAGVETGIDDDCWFEFEPDTGFVTLTGTEYSVDNGPITTDMYELNDAAAAGTVFAYGVQQANGTTTSTNAIDAIDPAEIDPDTDTFLLGNTYTGMNIVIVTLDVDHSEAQSLFDSNYVQYTTDLSVDSLPGWLYSLFGDQLNYIGISVYEY